MEKKKFKGILLKVGIISIVALFMLIPLALIRKQVSERESYHEESVNGITGNWGGPQTFEGPCLYAPSEEKEKFSPDIYLYPDSLKYSVKATTQELHRSIFDVQVYSLDVAVTGKFILDDRFKKAKEVRFKFNVSDLKGLQGNLVFTLGETDLAVTSFPGGALTADVRIDGKAKAGDEIPFRIGMKLNGTESVSFMPSGNLTEVEMTSDSCDPSFTGDYLPVEREVGPDGFSARWLVSKIMISEPYARFGVRMATPVTQYRQTERAVKYGLLIIFLVFIAGFIVEMVSGKPINIIQYLVIGASLVLFYSLLLAFSDFISFGISYLIAAGMTTLALGGYFFGIVRSKWSLLLAGLVAVTYGVAYVLLQLETFAFLAGTLVLFAILVIIMLLTRNLRIDDPKPGKE